jgi:hypothetical protein
LLRRRGIAIRKWRLTAAEETAVLEEYSTGRITAMALANRYGTSTTAVARLLHRRGIRIRGRLTRTEQNAVVIAYQAGTTAAELARRYGIDDTTVGRLLRREGIPTRFWPKHAVNVRAFDTLTEEAAYFVGFLTADGNLQRGDTGWQLRFGLSRKDQHHVERFRDFMGSDAPIRTTPTTGYGSRHGFCSVTIGSTQIARRLLALGFIPRKSERLALPALAWSSDYWRGVCDGDAWVGYSNNTAALQLNGWRPLMGQFSAYIQRACPLIYACPRPRQARTIWRVTLSGWNAVAVIRALYAHASIALPRKHAMAQRILADYAERDARRS